MRRRGYSLPLVMLVLTTMGLAIVSLTTVVAEGAKTSGSLAGRRRTLYACDGVVRALAVSAGDYFKSTPNPRTADLRRAVCGNETGPSCPTAAAWVPGFTIDEVAIETGAVNVLREIPSGPFAGQTSQRTDLSITVAMTSTSGRSCRVTQNMANGQIGLFQFAVFSGVPIDLFNPPPMALSGRTHINGDFCAGGSGRGLTIERLTVSGEIHSGCAGGSMPLVPSGRISTNGFFALNRATNAPRLLSDANDRSSGTWRQDALSTWNGNVQDSAHDVPSLRLPVATATVAQPGNNQDGVPLTNLETLRVMVDPPPLDGEAEASGRERLFHKADIRIINGVWYRRDGTVMWSDHTGAVNNVEEEFPLGVPGSVRAPPAGPTRFSYYERAGEAVANNPGTRSVVSYGTLAFRAAANEWVPGVAVSATQVNEAVNDAQRVDGTRTGFVDRRVALQSGEEAGRILPLNFDVQAFTEAMASSTPGELGSFFGGGARFNGIVWIGNSWPGHNDGFTTNPSASGFARTTRGYRLDGSTTPGLHRRPPLPLCREGVGGANLTTTQQQFPCSEAALPATDIRGIPRVNAVRVINAARINPDVFPRGLTIATNGPLYTLGNVNTASLTGGVPGTPRIDSPTGNWVPLMLAGDAVTILSANWTDRTANALGLDRTWGVPPAQVTSCPTPDAAPTTVVAAVIAGHVDSASTWGGGINNFPRFIECWSRVDNTIVGSLVIGYRSVYQRQRYHLFSYRPPVRLWSFDRNLASPARQPPGTPSFFVQAVERWQRD
jgi:hypothetical protein